MRPEKRMRRFLPHPWGASCELAVVLEPVLVVADAVPERCGVSIVDAESDATPRTRSLKRSSQQGHIQRHRQCRVVVEVVVGGCREGGKGGGGVPERDSDHEHWPIPLLCRLEPLQLSVSTDKCFDVIQGARQ